MERQTTLIGRPIKVLMPIYFFWLLPLVCVIRRLVEWAL